MNKINLIAKRLAELSHGELDAILTIVKELDKSKLKHPNFSDGSLSYAGNIVAEEAGELCQAINQYQYEDGDPYKMVDEAAHVGAVAIRTLCMVSDMVMPEYKPMDHTIALLRTIISWEKDLGDYESLETKLRSMYKIEKRK